MFVHTFCAENSCTLWGLPADFFHTHKFVSYLTSSTSQKKESGKSESCSCLGFAITFHSLYPCSFILNGQMTPLSCRDCSGWTVTLEHLCSLSPEAPEALVTCHRIYPLICHGASSLHVSMPLVRRSQKLLAHAAFQGRSPRSAALGG